jgi:16S rRNA (guanine966-N2)-methyltransferase
VTTVRVTSGSLRGRRVPVPAGSVRPTSERARQAFFNIVGPSIAGARFLDLFAGSGVFSFEAVSRGAARATAVDSNRAAAENIERLAKQWNAKVTVAASDVFAVLNGFGGMNAAAPHFGGMNAAAPQVAAPRFDLVYADPPYDFERYDELLAAIDEHAPLAPGATVAVEHRSKSDPFRVETKRLKHKRRAEYGEIGIDFFETT